MSAQTSHLRDAAWLDEQWNAVRFSLAEQDAEASAVLVIDEVQKIAGWAEAGLRNSGDIVLNSVQPRFSR